MAMALRKLVASSPRSTRDSAPGETTAGLRQLVKCDAQLRATGAHGGAELRILLRCF